MSKLEDLGDLCIACRQSTRFGSGRFVNRIPADDGVVAGYLCAECQCVECDRCGEKVLEYHLVGNQDTSCVCAGCLHPGEEVVG